MHDTKDASMQFNHQIPNQIFLILYWLHKYVTQNDFAKWQIQQESFALKQTLQLSQVKIFIAKSAILPFKNKSST